MRCTVKYVKLSAITYKKARTKCPACPTKGYFFGFINLINLYYSCGYLFAKEEKVDLDRPFPPFLTLLFQDISCPDVIDLLFHISLCLYRWILR